MEPDDPEQYYGLTQTKATYGIGPALTRDAMRGRLRRSSAARCPCRVRDRGSRA